MSQVPTRPLSDAEQTVVGRMLQLSGVNYSMPEQVVGKCDCGCASVDFLPNTEGNVVASDAYGRTSGGVDVGVLLWTRGGAVSGLEVYMLGVDTADLPTVESLRSVPTGQPAN
jgi:hypothetical protein